MVKDPRKLVEEARCLDAEIMDPKVKRDHKLDTIVAGCALLPKIAAALEESLDRLKLASDLAYQLDVILSYRPDEVPLDPTIGKQIWCRATRKALEAWKGAAK